MHLINPNLNGSVSSDLCNLLYFEEANISADCLISCEYVDVYEWVDVLGYTCQWYVIKFNFISKLMDVEQGMNRMMKKGAHFLVIFMI